MHQQVQVFITNMVTKFFLRPATVVEFGAVDINGNPRHHFPDADRRTSGTVTPAMKMLGYNPSTKDYAQSGVLGLGPVARGYIGVDWREGPNVDVVSLTHDFRPAIRPELVCSFEMLEHDPYAAMSLKHMAGMVADGGCLMVTAAGVERPVHELYTAPARSDTCPEGNHYQGLRLFDLIAPVLAVSNWEWVHGEEDFKANDVRACFARKRMPL
jgi:hypothetical protein